MEPPSQSLQDALGALRLAGPHDLRRAARLCTTIARDLPALDSVWIDALVRQRKLTLFQARELAENRADRLRLGEFVLHDRIGGHAERATYLARPIGGGAFCALKQIRANLQVDVSLPGRLSAFVDAVQELEGNAIVAPHRFVEVTGGIVFVSRVAPGLNACDWLARRGPLPWRTVVEVARPLSEGLAAAHRLGLVHGDIHASKLLLSRRGGASLVGFGIRAAISPVLSLHDDDPPESWQGTAPERIGTTAGASVATDAYSFGCLLWHLLAGRPAFLHGDPMSLLAAHRLRPLSDIREFADGVPEPLAEMISDLTRLDPRERLTDLSEVSRRLGRSDARRRPAFLDPASGRQALACFSIAASVLACLACAALFLGAHGAAPTILAARSPAAPARPGPTLATLPSPDPGGVVQLDAGGLYVPRDISFPGPLVIRGVPDRPATVVVTEAPLHLASDEVILEHVHVIHRPSERFSTGPSALLLVESQNLRVEKCRFESAGRDLDEKKDSPAAIAWRMKDRSDVTGGQVSVGRSVFRGVRQCLFLANAPRRIRMTDVLAVSLRAAISISQRGDRPIEVALDRLTLRDAGAVVAVAAGDAPVAITAHQSVLDLGEGGALFAGTDASGLSWQGAGVVATGPVLPIMSGARIASGEPIVVSGIAPARITFAGGVEGSDAASMPLVRGVPRQAGRSFGVDLASLPAEGPPIPNAR